VIVRFAAADWRAGWQGAQPAWEAFQKDSLAGGAGIMWPIQDTNLEPMHHACSNLDETRCFVSCPFSFLFCLFSWAM
jgi:hypothetical protein